MDVRQGFRRFAVVGAAVVLAMLVVAGPAAAGPGIDTDADGVLDVNDNCPTNANADQLDTDADNTGDACDNCPGDSNPGQANLDGDEFGDACDPDIDGDTIGNGLDNCPLVQNADQLDTDNDSTGDACEPPPPRPDARIRRGNFALTADDVYNTNAAGQSRSATVGNRGTATFTVQTRNDGAAPDDVLVQGPGSTNRFAVVYRDGPTNVTNDVVGGTFEYVGLAAGARRTLTVTITARAGTPVNAAITRRVTVTSLTDSSVRDAVKATVTRR